MLDKETKQQGEELKTKLKNLFIRASRLADIWAKKNTERAKADRLAKFWQYVETGTEWQYSDFITEEQKNEARETKKNPKEWVKHLDTLYFIESEKENEEKASRYNLNNYLYYICEVIGEELKPLAVKIRNQKGETFKQFAEILNEGIKRDDKYHPHNMRISIYKESDFSNSFCLNICIWCGGACGFGAEIYRYFDTDKEPKEKKEIREPKTMNGKQLAERVAKIEAYTKKAQTLRTEQYKKAKEWGLLDAVELLRYPQTEKAR